MMNSTIKIETRIFVILLAASFCLTSLISTADAVTRPKAPKNVKVTRISNTSAKLTWKRVKRAKGYAIYQKKNTGKYKRVKTIQKGSIRKWTAKKLNKNATYSYKIKAYKKYGKRKIYSRYSKVARLNPVRISSSIPAQPPTSPYGVVLDRWNIGSDVAAEYDSVIAEDSVTATMYSGGYLIIKGSAEVTDECMYGTLENEMPWLINYSGRITKVLFNDIEPTNMQRWFAGCTALSGKGNLPDSVTDMSETFSGCTGITDLSELSLPSNLTNMTGTFLGCSGITDLSGLTIPESVTDMSASFSRCTGITDLTGLNIPDNVSKLTSAFSGCTGITDLTGLDLPSELTGIVALFSGCTGITDISVLNIPDKVTNMALTFNGCTGITDISELSIPGEVTDISYTFDGCTGITDISELSIPVSVTNMSYTFNDCSGITNINGLYIPNSVTNMYCTFNGCTSITDISGLVIPSNITILEGTFNGCTGIRDLNGVNIPDNVTELVATFAGCTGITDISQFVIPYNSTRLSGTFYGCTGITDISDFTIPESVTSIFSIFGGCTGITDISGFTIPEGVTRIDRAFYNCTKLGGTMTIMGDPSSYTSCFENAATDATSTGVTVDYTAACTNIEKIIAEKSTTSNIIKGSLIEVVESWDIGKEEGYSGTGYEAASATSDVTASLLSNNTLLIQGQGDCMSGAFSAEMPWIAGYSNQIERIVIKDAAPTNMSRWFAGCSGITDIRGLTIPDSVTSMSYTFYGCTGITYINGLSIPVNLIDMSGTFRGCTGITNISGISMPGSITNMNRTFQDCTGITDINGFAIPGNVTEMSFTFYNCTKIGGTMTVMANPDVITSFFANAATDATSTGVTVDYTAACTKIDNIISTKSAGSNIVKGSLITP